ncbi:MAG: hypothetical protein ACLTDR_04140 [Adlercreutzia equolifaciens]
MGAWGRIWPSALAMITIGPATAPSCDGLHGEATWVWRSVFLVPLAAAVALTVVGIFVVRGGREPERARFRSSLGAAHGGGCDASVRGALGGDAASSRGRCGTYQCCAGPRLVCSGAKNIWRALLCPWSRCTTECSGRRRCSSW